ncbi:type VII secretion protein EccB [Streptomyces panaciradicis]|uniref:type VII secretion protein EccB n=1 Tax=Streptomyces panaciradicis TaxID=1470261 RepID=UPI00201CC2EE|nr:type VII secretion protein EccB [Streptomyces panaciradicis]MCL6675206.1 type VII secretion protein EccB [Streptomyces panaciradicis]
MQSKRDQVEAHVFMMSRLSSGMLLSDPDAPESPSGRTGRGAAMGMLIGALGAAGCVLFGLLSPGGDTSWKSADGLIVRKETGARYLYQDGVLRPVRNYASARLIGGSDLSTTLVSGASLRGTPHGAAVGITGAPDDLPAARDVNDGPWLVCSGLLGAADGRRTTTTLVVGARPSPGDGLTARQALLVSAPDRTRYLVWRGRRLRLDTEHGADRALGYGGVQVRAVSAEFLNTLPAGPDLTPPAVPGQGEKGPSLDGRPTRIGQLFTVQVPNSPVRYYLLSRQGLVAVTATQAALALGDPRTREHSYAGHKPVPAPLATDTADAHLAAGTTAAAPGWPASPPTLTGPAAREDVCTALRPTAKGPVTSVAVVSTLDAAPAPTPEEAAPACSPVDAVAVRPGAGAVVRALSADGGTLGDTTYLVTDAGVKYRMASSAAVTALGYGGTDAVGLPSPLLAMLPTGPDLDPAAASGSAPVRTTSAGGCATGIVAGHKNAPTDGRSAASPADNAPAAPTG